MEIRFHSPYRHAVSGLLVEIVSFAAFMLFAAGLALLAAWIR
ncbi:MAG: hypothetical protein Q7W51_03455 [Coriobacteriia bacterium]|nr:hypothetical protein [Coriobacteriia bacterium]